MRSPIHRREGVDRGGELRKAGDLGSIDISILGAYRWGVARGVLVSGMDNLSRRFGQIVRGRHESNFKLLILLSARDGTHVAGSLPCSPFALRRRKKESRDFVERSCRFFGSLRLPYSVESDKIRANLDNGVITVTLPKCGDKERR